MIPLISISNRSSRAPATIWLVLWIAAAIVWLAGCGKTEQPNPPGAAATTSPPAAPAGSPAESRPATAPGAEPGKSVVSPPADENRDGLSGSEVPDPNLVDHVRRLVEKWKPQPIPAGDTARMGADYEKRYDEWFSYIDLYKQFGNRNPAWDAEAIEFFKLYAAFIEDADDIDNARQAKAQGADLNDRLKCIDPLFLHVYSHLLQWFAGPVDLRAAIRLAARAPDRFMGSKYPSRVSYRAFLVGREDKANIGIAQIATAATSLDISRDEHRMFLERLGDDLDGALGEHRDQLYVALNRQPGVDPWFLKLMLGRENIRLAWEARGHEFASLVPADRLPIFFSRLRRARVHLLEAWKLRPEAPEAAAELVRVTLSLGEGIAGETPRFWFDQAVQAEADYYRAYSALYESLRPRWGGSLEAVLAFGRECLATGRFDTEIPRQFDEAVILLGRDLGTWRDAVALPGVIGDLEKEFAGYRDGATKAADRHLYASRLACLAWLAGDLRLAQKRLDELGDDVVPSAFINLETTLNHVRRAISHPELEAAWQQPFEPEEKLTGVDVSRSRGLQLICVAGGRVRILWQNGGKPQQSIVNVAGRVVAAAVAPDYSTLAVSTVEDEGQPPRVLLINVGDGAVRGVLEPKQAGFISLKFSPDGKTLATTGSKSYVILWNVKTAAPWSWGNLTEHLSGVFELAFSPGGDMLATGCYDGTFKIWDLPQDLEATAKPLVSRFTGTGYREGFNSLQFSPDGQRLMVSSSLKVEMWNLATLKKESTIPGLKAALSPDGSTIAASGVGRYSTEANLFDAATGKEIRRFRGAHKDTIVGIRFSSDGKTLFTVDSGPTLITWNVSTGQEIQSPPLPRTAPPE